MKLVTCVVDMQFGSTGKGQVAGAWAELNKPDTAVTANGPNAGHTYRWGPDDNQKVVFTVLPVAAVVKSVSTVLLGPGAVIDLDKLIQELQLGQTLGLMRLVEFIIHPNAMCVLERHREAEKELVRIGSTMKGTSEAMIEKIRRIEEASTAWNLRHHIHNLFNTAVHWSANNKCTLDISAQAYDDAIDRSDNLIVEGSQGHSLGLHTRFYPHTTSRDVSVHQLMADCRIPRMDSYMLQVIGVCRTYPIRVANRYDASGRMIGTSGGHYSDQMELDWERDLNRMAELTTVTKLPRRIFSFSYDQIMEACRVNDPTYLALTFADYLEEAPAWLSSRLLRHGPLGPKIDQLHRGISRVTNIPVKLVSYGPMTADMVRQDADDSRIFLPLTTRELP